MRSSLFNRLIEGPSLYDSQLFQDVIEKEGRRLGRQLDEGGDLSHLSCSD